MLDAKSQETLLAGYAKLRSTVFYGCCFSGFSIFRIKAKVKPKIEAPPKKNSATCGLFSHSSLPFGRNEWLICHNVAAGAAVRDGVLVAVVVGVAVVTGEAEINPR
jgi:hypothetical protein